VAQATSPLPHCHPERSSPIFSTAPHSGASGCAVEGPWQHVKSYLARWNPSQFQPRVLSVIPPALSPTEGPRRKPPPKTILPPIPFFALTHPPVISTGMNDSSRFHFAAGLPFGRLPARRRQAKGGSALPLFQLGVGASVHPEQGRAPTFLNRTSKLTSSLAVFSCFLIKST
jgi:hypothetical protein